MVQVVPHECEVPAGAHVSPAARPNTRPLRHDHYDGATYGLRSFCRCTSVYSNVGGSFLRFKKLGATSDNASPKRPPPMPGAP